MQRELIEPDIGLLFGPTHFVARSLLCRLLRDEGDSQRHGLKWFNAESVACFDYSSFGCFGAFAG